MKKFQKIACIIGVIILLSTYVLTLISAIFYREGFQEIFTAALFSTVVIPVILYAMIFVYKLLNKRNN